MSAQAATVGGWTGAGLAHEAFLFDDDRQARDRCVPFVREGLDRGEPIVVVAGGRVRRVLEEAFGDLTAQFAVFAEAEGAWLGGAGTLAAYQESMRPLLEARRPWRLIGEPVWLAGTGGAVWSRFEAVANEAFAGYPYYSLCLHDRRLLDAPLVDAQLRAHPTVWDGSAPVPNPSYVPTSVFLRSVEPRWEPAPAGPDVLRVASAWDALPALRPMTDRLASPRRRDDVLLAVYELVSNALRAAGAAEVRHWVSGGFGVWEVSDEGPGMYDATAGYAPPAEGLRGGRGLWLARGLADDATVRERGPGTAVRLYFRDTG